MDGPDEFNARFLWQVEEQDLFEAIRDGEAAYIFQLRFREGAAIAGVWLSRKHGSGGFGSCKKSVGGIDVSVFRIVDPLSNEIAFGGFALTDHCH